MRVEIDGREEVKELNLDFRFEHMKVLNMTYIKKSLKPKSSI